jgi:hypothetical protein
MMHAMSDFVRALRTALVVAGFWASACGGGDGGSVAGHATLFFRGDYSQSYSGFPAFRMNLGDLKGSYGAGCRIHAGEAWALHVGGKNPLSAPAPKLARGDSISTCQLTLTGMRGQLGTGGSPYDIPLAAPIPLSRTYHAQAVVTTEAPPFWVNARLGSLDEPPTEGQADTYYGDFEIHLVVSFNKPLVEPTSPSWTYSAYRVLGKSVPPNYVVTWNDLSLKLDGNLTIQSGSAGNLILRLPDIGPQPGEEWKLIVGNDSVVGAGMGTLQSFGHVDRWYQTQPILAMGAISDRGNVTIGWDQLALVGESVARPNNRFLIVKHSDAGGVPSYEMLVIALLRPLP